MNPIMIWVWWGLCFWLVALPAPLAGRVGDGWIATPPDPPVGKVRGKPKSTNGADPHPRVPAAKGRTNADTEPASDTGGFG